MKFETLDKYKFNLILFILYARYSICDRELRVDVSPNIACRLGGKSRTIVIEAAAGVENPNFRHAAGNIIFEVPAHYCV